MKILVVADMHGYEKEFDSILKGNFKDIDVIINIGDLVDMYRIPEGFAPIDMADMMLQKLIALNKPLLCIPGNHDPFEVVELFDGYGVNLHNRVKKIKGVTFLGFGGAETPFNTIFEPGEEEIRKALAKHSIPQNTVLVVHQPPINTKQDMLTNGKHVGSNAVRNYITEKNPMLVLTGHIHEGIGIDHIGKSVIFNPGPAFEGKYGIVDISEKKLRCEMKSAAP